MTHRSKFVGAAASAMMLVAANAQDPIDFVPKESTWKYLDQGQDPGSDWTYLDFDDSSWAEGAGQLGFTENDENTLISRGTVTPYPTSYYFRHTFPVTQAQVLGLEGADFFYQLIFNILRDDGAVVYLNEVEIFRSNVDPFAFVDQDTVALGAVGGTAEDTYFEVIANGEGLLFGGQNVLAVSVHQNSAGSSDVSFDMSMSAVKVAPTFGVYRPPQKINFDQDPRGGLRFNPDPFGTHDDLGWDTLFNGAGPTAFGITNRDPVSTSPLDGFIEGYAWYVNNGLATLTTQTKTDFDSELRYRIDLRNHRNVQVSFDVRCDDTGGFGYPAGNGFETSDYIKFRHSTSGGGSDYVKEEVLNLPGGGSGGLDFEKIELVNETDTKKGLVPTNGNLGLTWTQLGFTDTSWRSFTKGVGYDSGQDYVPFIGWNTGTVMKSKNATCYMRIPFTVTDKESFEALSLYARDDDGFIAYINGSRVTSKNGPTNPQWNSQATANHPDGTAKNLKAYPIDNHLDKLVNGNNVLAIHALNNPSTSSDFLVSVTLEARRANQTPRNDPPESLNDINFGVDGAFYRFTFPDADGLGGVADSANSYVFECEMRNNEGNETIYFDNFLITGDPITVDSYDAWVKIETPFEEGESAEALSDPDRDGIVNILEYAFGSDPQVNSQTMPSGDPILPQMTIVEDTDTGQYFYELEWRQRDSPAAGTLDFPYGGYTVQGIQYLPQFSTDMDFWTDGRFGTAGALLSDPFENEDGTITYRMRYRDPILDPNDPDPFFGRVLVRTAIPIIEDGLF